MKRIGVLTSGGDAPGMNAALRAVVRTAVFKNVEIYGVYEGYKGLLEGNVKELNISSVADIIQRGGTALRSARSQEFTTPEGIEQAIDMLKVFKIEGLIVLGGDGTFRGAMELAKRGIPVVGIPCTIDNDMGYTDFTIGFFTAIETVIDAIGKIRDTSSSHGRGNIIEVMGRHCGDIAVYAGLAGGAENIIIPEEPFSMNNIIERTIRGRNRGKIHNIIVLTEGVANAYEVAETLVERTGVDFRVTVLGHVQRGGSPSAFDRIMASKMGYHAVEHLLANQDTQTAIGMRGAELIYVPMSEAVSTEKKMNEDIYTIAQVLSI